MPAPDRRASRGAPRSSRVSLLVALVVAGFAHGVSASVPDAPAVHEITLFVVRRTWHVEVGFAVSDLDARLADVSRQFPRASYLFFGFGDRQYLLSRHKGTPNLLRALWPGPALLLVTAIDGEPIRAFGAANVVAFELSGEQASAAQDFIWRSLGGTMDAHPLETFAPGPYPGSTYYAAPQRYSALHTCNTWAAESLRAAHLPVRARGVIYADQLWSQLHTVQSHGGGLPF